MSDIQLGRVTSGKQYELVVYELESPAPPVSQSKVSQREPRIHRIVPAAALSWTPPRTSCLEPGQNYAWTTTWTAISIATTPTARAIPSVTPRGVLGAKGRSRTGIADHEDFIHNHAAVDPGNSGRKPPMKARLRFALIPVVLVSSTAAYPVADEAPSGSKDIGRYELPETDAGLRGDGPLRREKWFRDLWRERRSRFDSRRRAEQGSVVFLGDSITQGWGDDFGGAFGDLRVANRGISGDTTRGMLIRLAEDVIALEPQCVVILAGTNDLEFGAPPEAIAGNMRLIVADLIQHDEDLPIVLSLVMPSSAENDRPVEAIRELNELYAQIAEDHRHVTLVDTWRVFADESGDAKPDEFPDLLHPNEIGYAKWAQTLQPVLERLELLEPPTQ